MSSVDNTTDVDKRDNVHYDNKIKPRPNAQTTAEIQYVMKSGPLRTTPENSPMWNIGDLGTTPTPARITTARRILMDSMRAQLRQQP